MIRASNISKQWGSVQALDSISIEVGPGTIHGLIGADGAGKTTLFDILVTLVRPDSGQATVAGCDILRDYRTLRKRVGYMPATFSLYGDLSVIENLRFFANIYGESVESVRNVGAIWDQIAPFANRPAAQLSGGMKQKLALCCAMIHNPEVLMLDEPTTGVDPTSRREFWESLRELAGQGRSLLVSTSYMDEAARCDRITLLHHGVSLAELDPREVTGHYQGILYELESPRQAEVLAAVRQTEGPDTCYSFGDTLHLNPDGPRSEQEIVARLEEAGLDPSLVSLRRIDPTVEDLFIQRIR